MSGCRLFANGRNFVFLGSQLLFPFEEVAHPLVNGVVGVDFLGEIEEPGVQFVDAHLFGLVIDVEERAEFPRVFRD